MPICPNSPMWITTRKEGVQVFAQARCKLWSCPVCAEINKQIWQARMLYAVLEHSPGDWAFLTLTPHPKARSAEASYTNLASGWNRINTRFKREFGTIMYVRVAERFRNGRHHFHALYRPSVPTRWWKDKGAECGIGYMAESSLLDGPQAVFYCTKYMTKTVSEHWKSRRRIVCSRNFPDRANVGERERWKPVGVTLFWSDIVAYTDGLKIAAWDETRQRSITTDDFESS